MGAADRERLLAGVLQFYGPVTFDRLVGLVPAIRAGGRMGPAEVNVLSCVKEMTNLRKTRPRHSWSSCSWSQPR